MNYTFSEIQSVQLDSNLKDKASRLVRREPLESQALEHSEPRLILKRDLLQTVQVHESFMEE